jgi:copper oxidase (laccase) domain-containing protein
VLSTTVEQMRRLGATAIRAEIGPHIHRCCYEFGLDDLDTLVACFGPSARSVTNAGRPALDMTAAVIAALAQLGVPAESIGPCTGCHGDRYWSHRARGERGRQAMVVWMEEP